MFHPRIIDTFTEGYRFNFFKKDVLSGLTVAIVAIPLSIAFAIASGGTPLIGIFTAIIGGIFVSLFGGSKYNISGPAGAFIGVIYNVIGQYGYNGLLISTFIAGIFLMIFAIFKCGKLMKYIPQCVVLGFGVGLGIDIFSGQISDFFGLNVIGGSNFLKKIELCINHINNINIYSVIIGLITMLITLIVRKIKPSLPAFLIAIIVSCIIARIFHFNIESINSRFGMIHLEFPEFHKNILEEIEHPMHLIRFLSSAFTIAVLAGIEALLAATIADKMTGDKHLPNTELFSLGFANCISALFGCLPIAGTTARTIVNVKSGAKSSFAGVFHGIFLIILLAIFAELISSINMPTIAGILFIVAIDMMSWKKVYYFCKNDKRFNIFMLFFTAICVLLFGIVVAIIINTILYNVLLKINKKIILFNF